MGLSKKIDDPVKDIQKGNANRYSGIFIQCLIFNVECLMRGVRVDVGMIL